MKRSPKCAASTHSSAIRDDRTRRTLELLVGTERADLSLTHFSTRCVEVYVDAATLKMPNGFLAAMAALNMLSRFVGAVELWAMGEFTPALTAAVEAEIVQLRRIDTREGRSVRWARMGSGEGIRGERASELAARIWIGHASAGAMIASDNPEIDVHVAFDGWACALQRGAPTGAVVESSVPFGALTAACFAVAEVFKTLVASSVPEDVAPIFHRRFTHSWRFSAWTMDRLDGSGSHIGSSALPLDPLPPLTIDEVLQVGAGAVGNATVLALISTASASGSLVVLDAKQVDVKNLNRCFFFTEDSIGHSKAEALERAVMRLSLRVQGRNESFSPETARDARIILSTVDNNEVRHRMQESLPEVLVEGATGGTTISVVVHTPGNGRSCLVCRHPDPEVGATRRIPLSLKAAAELTGFTEAEIASGSIDGMMLITDEVIARVAARSQDAAVILRRARDAGQDLCGALGDLRTQLGTVDGPREASVPFVSNLAGVLAAAEVVKTLVRATGVAHVPILDNVLEIDLARDYSRHTSLAYAEPPRSDCALCQMRAREVAEILARRHVRQSSRSSSPAAP